MHGSFGIRMAGECARETLSAVRPLEYVSVYSPNPGHRSEFAKAMSKKTGLRIVAVDTPSEVYDADIVIAATNAKEPIIHGKFLKQGTHFSSIGPYEVDGEAMIRANVMVIHSRERYRTHIAGEGQFGKLVRGNPYVSSEYDWENHVLSRFNLAEVRSSRMLLSATRLAGQTTARLHFS